MFKSKTQLYLAFALVVFATAFGNLSQTAVSAMLVDIDAEYRIAAGVGQWATTAYMLVLGITVPVVAYLSRRFSLRTLMTVALLLFFTGSAVGYMAPHFWLLLVGRVLQAMSAGITMPLVQTMAMTRFPKGQNATAMGVAGIALGFAPNIGPVLGGAMAQTWGWRSFFLLLMMSSVVLLVGVAAVLRGEDKSAANARLDVASLLMSTVGFGSLLLGISNASSFGLADPLVWVPCLVGAVILVMFLRRQNRLEQPLINLDIFKSRSFCGAFAVQNALMASYLGITLLASLYIQDLCGGSAIDAGLVFVPVTVGALFLNPLSGYLTDKIGVRPVALVGSISMAFGAVAMCFMDASTPLWLVMTLQFFRGLGMSCLMGPIMSFALANLPRSITADGSSFIVTVRQASASLGTAGMVLVLTYGVQAWGQVALAYQLAFGLSAVFAIIMLACVVKFVKE